MRRALLLDVGYVIMEVSWPALAAYEAATGASSGDGRSPAGPASDPRWEDHVAGRMSTAQYWDHVARARGFDGLVAMFRALARVVPDEMFDQRAVALIRDARTARHRVGALSNDSYTFLGKAFFVERPEFAELEAFVDAAETGVRKPAPEAYLLAAEALSTPPEAIVFLDDTPECVEGARAVGMAAILVDPLDRLPAFEQAREMLGLALDPTP